MNQELMTLDFWQDTVIYEGKIFPIGTLACDALNQSTAWNVKRRTGCFCTLSYGKGSCADNGGYSQRNAAVLQYEYSKT